jgi:hypothetical protein
VKRHGTAIEAAGPATWQGFSIKRLMRLLLALGRDIEIKVKGRARGRSC